MRLASLAKRCQCCQPHVQVQRKFTKLSATYIPLLVDALAEAIYQAINEVVLRRNAALALDISGLENHLVNEVALLAAWEVHSSWIFQKERHINILEEASILCFGG